MIRLRSFSVAVALGMGVVAQGQIRYAQRLTNIKVGTLVIESAQKNGQADNPTPHVWYNLDTNFRIKPSGWSISNPRPATIVTAGIETRWTALSGSPVAGTRIGKDAAPYWEVMLRSASESQLSDYDALLLSVHGEVQQGAPFGALRSGLLSLQPIERERLRSYVDQGGLLWIDVSSRTAVDEANGAPVSFGSTGGTTIDPSFAALFGSPVLNFPYQITAPQVGLSQLQEFDPVGSTAFYGPGIRPANVGVPLESVLASVSRDFDQLQVVVDDPTGPVVAVARLGDGAVLITSRGSAVVLNRASGNAVGIPNDDFYATRDAASGLPRFDRAGDAAAALIVNALHLVKDSPQPFTGSRKSNASTVDLGAPLLRTFEASRNLSELDPLVDANAVLDFGGVEYSHPALFRGLIVVPVNYTCDAGSFGRLFVYDANPNRDLDGNGNTDDGLPDSDLSAGMDLLWISQRIPGSISSPSCTSVVPQANPETGAIPTLPSDQIYVVDDVGKLHLFGAFPTTLMPLDDVPEEILAGGVVPPSISGATFDMGAAGRGPYAPTIHEGIVYVPDTHGASRSGRVWAFGAAYGDYVKTRQVSGTFIPWIVGDGGDYIAEISSPATIGYIPILDNSGGQDLVAYVATRPDPTAVNDQDATSGVTSVWLGVRGERPQSEPRLVDANTGLEVITRANLTNLKVYLPPSAGDPTVPIANDPLGVRVSVFDSNGNPLPAATLATIFNGKVEQIADGILKFGVVGAAWENMGYSMRLDYRIDWGSGIPSASDSIKRGSLYFSDETRSRRVLGAPALGPNGTIFAVVSDRVRGGGLWAMREEGRGRFRMLYHYELFDSHLISLSDGSPVQYRETVIDEDPITLLEPAVAGQISQLSFQGGPAVRGGAVFVTATGQKSADLNATVLMAFKANPDTIRIPVGFIPESFVLVQPDFTRSTNPLQPERNSVMQLNQFIYEQATGTIRIDNVMASSQGPVLQPFSNSQPVILRRSGQPDVLVEPDSIGGTWSPLLWYTVLQGSGTSGRPVVTGNTVFLFANSKLPDMLAGATAAAASEVGMMFAMDADTSTGPPDTIANSERPWVRQAPMFSVSGSVVTGNERIRWPQTKGANSFAEWGMRVRQSSLANGETAFGVAAGEGALFVWGPTRLYGFTRGDLLVADEGRLVRLDASGNPTWASDLSAGPNANIQTSATATVRPLVRPTRAYRLGETEMVVADPGSNRIVRMSVNGREIRSLSALDLDANYRPDGWQAGSPEAFNAPSDVNVFATTEATSSLTDHVGTEYWVHYLIADSGNRRIIELVDRYATDPVSGEILEPVVSAGKRQLGILVRHSSAQVSGKNFRYNSVARVFNPATNGFFYAGGIGGSMPTTADLGLETAAPGSSRESGVGNGGIVLYDDAQTQIISKITVPGIAANIRWTESLGSFNGSVGQITRVKPLGAVQSVTMRYVPYDADGDTVFESTRLAIMFADSDGVFEIFQRDVGLAEPWYVRWMLPNWAFRVMRGASPTATVADLVSNPRDFRANFARRLDSGEVLVVNGYVGRTRDNSPFNGDVMLLNGEFDSPTNPGFSFTKTNLGFSTLSIRLRLADLQGIRGLSAPVFADLK